VKRLLEQLDLEPVSPEGVIDAGAEEELFRRVGQQAARQALVQRWEQADQGASELACEGCGQRMRALGERSKRVRTLCGEEAMRRQVYYCSGCRRTQVPLDQRLGLEQGGMTAGLARVVCRTALELAYQQSQRLLSDTLGFSPCSAREVERIAKQHGQGLEASSRAEQTRPERKVRGMGSKPQAQYCLAIDGVMIAGLVDGASHCVPWHEVKLAAGFDPRQIQPSFYVAGREEAEGFGKRLWSQLEQRGLDERSFRQVLGDGARWIWNLAESYFPAVPQLLDFYHAAEHLHATAEVVWPEQAMAYRWWQQRLVGCNIEIGTCL